MFTVDTVTIFKHSLNFARCTVTYPLLQSISPWWYHEWLILPEVTLNHAIPLFMWINFEHRSCINRRGEPGRFWSRVRQWWHFIDMVFNWWLCSPTHNYLWRHGVRTCKGDPNYTMSMKHHQCQTTWPKSSRLSPSIYLVHITLISCKEGRAWLHDVYAGVISISELAPPVGLLHTISCNGSHVRLQ